MLCLGKEIKFKTGDSQSIDYDMSEYPHVVICIACFYLETLRDSSSELGQIDTNCFKYNNSFE